MIEVAVRDDGRGISPDQAKRVFEPFYTTKADGMGMGLPISQTIVEAHGGRLSVAAHASHGTTFRMTLPEEKGDRTHVQRPDGLRRG